MYGHWIGDYQGITATADTFHPIWNDTRTGQLEIFTASVPAHCPQPGTPGKKTTSAAQPRACPPEPEGAAARRSPRSRPPHRPDSHSRLHRPHQPGHHDRASMPAHAGDTPAKQEKGASGAPFSQTAPTGPPPRPERQTQT